MARIQVLPLPLPTRTLGEAEHTPFILVIDEVNPFEENWPHAALDALKAGAGAAFVLVMETSLYAPGALTLTDEERDQLREYLLTPRRVVLGPDQDPDSLTVPPVRGPLHATP